MTTTPKWTFTDGWILMSVFLTHGDSGASLDEVIAAADVMNHAIPTAEELSCSLTRLASCGILIENNERFRIADKYIPELAKAYQGRGGLFSTPDKGKKWLSKADIEVDHPVQISISDERLSLSYDLYLKSFGDAGC